MKKKLLTISLITFLILMGFHISANNEAEKSTQNMDTTAATVAPTNQASVSNPSYSMSEWMPNHININITFKKVDDDGIEEYFFISPTEGWKTYIETIGGGQRSIILYKTIDKGNH